MKIKSIVIIFALAGLFTISCKKNNGCAKSEKAVVFDFSDSDTCGIVFQLEDGSYVEPSNLSEYSALELTDGKLIWLSWKETSGASLCGIGTIGEIKCISDREY